MRARAASAGDAPAPGEGRAFLPGSRPSSELSSEPGVEGGSLPQNCQSILLYFLNVLLEHPPELRSSVIAVKPKDVHLHLLT